MKTHFLLIVFFLSSVALSACGASLTRSNPDEAWTVYQAARETLVNPNFPAYTFEYPSYWRVEEAANQLTFASENSLLKDPPDRLGPGQIIAGLSIYQDISAQETVETFTSSLGSRIQLEEMVAVRLNGRQAVYQTGSDSETGDASFILAIDMGKETRGLLTARMAAGELEKWEEVLFKMAGSLQVEE